MVGRLIVLMVLVLTVFCATGLADCWTEMGPDPHPCARWGHAMVYCDAGDQVVLYGGNTGATALSDMWVYDFNSNQWIDRTEDAYGEDSPGFRYAHAMAHDTESDYIVLFGGYDPGYTMLGDTWEYNCDTGLWEESDLVPPAAPDPRQSHAMAYDAESDWIILFGGLNNEVGDLGDTWAYDCDHDIWVKREPEENDVTPPPRRYHDMAYDEESDRIILFGGYQAGERLGDTWAYDCNTDTWEQRQPELNGAVPEARWSHGTAYQAEIDRVFMFGGGYTDTLLDDTWVYDYNNDIWQEVPCEHPSSGRTARHGIVYDADSDMIILFGGSDGNALGDTWAWEPLYVDAPDEWLTRYWNWIAIPAYPYLAAPGDVLGFECGGRLWCWDKYGKTAQVYRPPFVTFDLTVAESYLLWLDESPDPVSYAAILPDRPCDFRMGRMGWTWLGMPGIQELGGDEFMDTVMVKYPSDLTGDYRTAREDWQSGDPWLSWGWSWWDPYAQAPQTFTPYLPWNDICYPWLGYRVWVMVGTAASEEGSDQVTLIWP